MLSRANVTAATVAVLLAGGATAQKPRADTANVNKLVRQLDSSDPMTRAVAFETLNQRPGFWRGKGDLLVRLIERDDELMESTLKASNGKEGVGTKYGEEYAEESVDLGAACSRYCPDAKSLWLAMDLRHARSDVEGVRHDGVKALGIMTLPSSGYPASARATMESVLLEATRDQRSSWVQQMAIFSLSSLVSSDHALSATTRAAIHESFVAATADRSPDVRIKAVEGLGLFSDQSDRPLLSRIAESDTGYLIDRGVTVYQVRVAAKQALKKLQPQ